ncbi:MAG: winged helix-turn-helix transcriptional regulator, partial [Coprococcus sp.]
YPVIPPKTEYSLIDFGKSLTPILDELCKWGEDYLNEIQTLEK